MDSTLSFVGETLDLPCPIDLTIRPFQWNNGIVTWEDGEPNVYRAARTANS